MGHHHLVHCMLVKKRHEEMINFMGGGDMIKTVERDHVTYNISPHRFEAGTPGIVQMIGLRCCNRLYARNWD